MRPTQNASQVKTVAHNSSSDLTSTKYNKLFVCSDAPAHYSCLACLKEDLPACLMGEQCRADEDEDEGTGEDDADMLPAENASSAATYWDRLLRHHWQALEKEEGAPSRIGDLLMALVAAP